MVEFTLPQNSKVHDGIIHSSKSVCQDPKKLKIYRWDPEKKENPRIDSYEIDKKKMWAYGFRCFGKNKK